MTLLSHLVRGAPTQRRTKRKGVKSHRNYTVEEIARLLGVARGTVRRWTQKGLPFVTDQRPRLIRGEDLLEFLASLKAPKQRCMPSECYCFKCRAPREPAAAMADIILDRSTSGNLRGLCPVCGGLTHKRVSLGAIDLLRAKLDVAIKQAGPSFRDTFRSVVSHSARRSHELPGVRNLRGLSHFAVRAQAMARMGVTLLPSVTVRLQNAAHISMSARRFSSASPRL